VIELSELVQQLRRELYRSVQAAKDEPLRFELGSIELEVEFTATRETAGGGKLRFWVAEAGADVTAVSGSVQRVKLTMSPMFADSPVTPWIDDRADVDEH
jgi:Trypsin-co-occurring domain 2